MFDIYEIYKKDKTKVTYIDTHMHDDFEINFILTKDVKIISEDQVFVSSEGTVCFFSPYSSHKIDARNNPYVRYVLFFNENHITSACRTLGPIVSLLKNSNSYIVSLTEKETAQLLSLFESAVEISNHKSALDDYKKINALGDILYFLLPIFEKQISNKTINHNEIKEILTYINDHLHEDINVDSIANHFNIGTTTIWRLFRKHIQLPPKEYILKKRIARASELLAEGATVKEAAAQSGFNSYTNFIRTFTHHMGVTPHKYSRNN